MMNRRESGTARCVEQRTIPGPADAAANRSVDIATNRIDTSAPEAGIAAIAGTIHIAFEADDELVDLVVVTNVGTADDAIRAISAEANTGWLERSGGPTKLIADLT